MAIKKFKCPLCPKEFSRWDNVLVHKRSVHPDGKAKEDMMDINEQFQDDEYKYRFWYFSGTNIKLLGFFWVVRP